VDDIIDKLGREDYYPAALKAFTREGKVYGVPSFISAMNVFYRTDVFKEAGLQAPRTWEELLEAATKLAENPTGLHGQEYGFTVPAGKNMLGCYFIYAFMRANGADIFDEKGNVNFNSPETVETIEFLKKLYSQASPRASTGYSWGDVKESYWSGRAAMIPYYGGVSADMPKYAPELVKKTGIVSIPPRKGRGTHAFIYAWVIPKYTPYPEEAKDFILNTLMVPENHIAWLNSDATDCLPPRKSIAENPRFWENPTVVMLEPLVKHMLNAVQYGDVFALGTYPTRHAGEILGSLVVADALQGAIFNPDRPVKDIVAEVDKKIREIVGQ
jgi:multiple sugar transport system substrate-binding protein